MGIIFAHWKIGYHCIINWTARDAKGGFQIDVH